MRIFGISDLHLSLGVDKPMDIFGDHWEDHHLQIEAAWRERVRDDDIVLCPGDTSWGMKPNEAQPDLEWLEALPGRKILVKGNHDYWWPGTRKKLRDLLPDSIHTLKKNALVLDGTGFIGVRGSDIRRPADKSFDEHRATIEREITEFRASIVDLRENHEGYDRIVALFHYPPIDLDGMPSVYSGMVEASGAELCVYGHLHTKEWCSRGFEGQHNGVEYRLLSCDHLEFRPVLLRDEVR
ncbi:MAG: metallophosphoesterase [Planctomycetota bacterium]